MKGIEVCVTVETSQKSLESTLQRNLLPYVPNKKLSEFTPGFLTSVKKKKRYKVLTQMIDDRSQIMQTSVPIAYY